MGRGEVVGDLPVDDPARFQNGLVDACQSDFVLIDGVPDIRRCLVANVVKLLALLSFLGALTSSVSNPSDSTDIERRSRR